MLGIVIKDGKRNKHTHSIAGILLQKLIQLHLGAFCIQMSVYVTQPFYAVKSYPNKYSERLIKSNEHTLQLQTDDSF